MKTLEELKTFAEGYRACVVALEQAQHTDDWVVWGGYDINFAGREYAAFTYNDDLRVNVYPAGWGHELPDPIYSFTVGEEA